LKPVVVYLALDRRQAASSLLGAGSESSTQRRRSKIKDRLKTLSDPNRVDEGSYHLVFERIGHDVINLDARFTRMKKMLMVPEPVRPQSLFVNEKMGEHRHGLFRTTISSASRTTA
jgi:hypothetical protein